MILLFTLVKQIVHEVSIQIVFYSREVGQASLWKEEVKTLILVFGNRQSFLLPGSG